jgi:GTP-binding protein
VIRTAAGEARHRNRLGRPASDRPRPEPGPEVPRPIIAIVGRPNVGKSTLFNRLAGRRQALVKDIPGVTRDRLYGRVEFERWHGTIVDTGGFDPSPEEVLVDGIRRQVLAALEECDLVLFVVDARSGLTALDEEIAAVLRRSARPTVLVANKVEGVAQEHGLGDLHALGFGEAWPVSAEHGRGVAELLEEVRRRVPGGEGPVRAPRADAAAVAVAIVGRPNVGKSSLVNALVGRERVLVDERPGTTRDAVDTPFTFRGQPFVLIDTAGIRRKGRVTAPLEKLAVMAALRSLARCRVAIVLLDAAEGLTAQDAHIAGYVDQAGRAAVIAVNKWDLVPPGMVRRAEVVEQIRERLAFLDHAPVCFTSAVTGGGLAELLDLVKEVAAAARRRVPPQALREALQRAIDRRPISVGGVPLTIQSATQVGIEPPTFVVRVNRPADVHFSYERYLVNSLRREFGFPGSPIRLVLRKATTTRPRRVQR